MTDNPQISIVLPIYNGERYLAQSIESVLAQNYSDWELIIVDDCSTDNSPAIIQQYAAQYERIRAIRHQENKKLPAALNTGFYAARGTYFTWTSDDNRYRPEALETLLDALEENDDIDLVYSNYTLIDEHDSALRRVRVPAPEMLVRKSTVGASFLFHRQVFEALNGYDETLFLIEDYDFWIRASKQFKLMPLHQDLYEYRDHTETLTTQRRIQVMQAREEMLIHHLPDLEWARRIDLARGYLHISELAAERGARGRAFAYVFKAILQDPFAVLRYFVKRFAPISIRDKLLKQYQRIKEDALD
jgi:glycosyltransferase involved in cell wall biosynthesis